MSLLTYNGVTLETLDIRSLNSETVYDQGDQSVTHTKTVITAVGTITGVDAATFAATLTDTRKKLLTPRANLLIQVGDSDLYNITAPDDMGGPKPRRVEITEWTGEVFAVITFELEINVTECATGSATNIVMHRYSVTHELDELFYTKRTIRGTIRVRDAASTNNPDALRGLITPAIPQGFIRESAIFVVTPNGLELEYEITDKEKYKLAPFPAIKATGSFAEQMTDNMFWFRAFSLELEGHKTASKGAMLQAAFQIAKTRIEFNDFLKERILQMKVEEKLYENAVSLNIVSQVYDLQTNDNYAYPSTSKLFETIPNLPDNSPDPGPYGTAMIAAAKMAFLTPCSGTASPGSTTSLSASSSGSAIQTAVANDGNLPGSQTATKLEANANPYVLWEEEIEFIQDNGAVMLPSSLQETGGTVYQLHNPVARVRQQGRAQRLNASVDVALPRHRSDSVVAMRSVKHHAPQLSSDKQNFIYSASWGYELLVPFSSPGNFAPTADGKYIDTGPAVPMPIPRNYATQAVHEAAKLVADYSMSPSGSNTDGYPL